MALASGTDIAIFGALDNHPPATNGMVLDQLNAMWALSATGSGSTDVACVFRGQMPNVYGGEAVDVIVKFSNAGTTNNVLFSAELERDQDTADASADNFAALTDGTAATVPGTANQYKTATIASVTLPASFTGGELFRLRVKRRKSQAGDTNTSTSLIHSIRIAVH